MAARRGQKRQWSDSPPAPGAAYEALAPPPAGSGTRGSRALAEVLRRAADAAAPGPPSDDEGEAPPAAAAAVAAPVEPYAEFATRTLAIAAAERGVVPPRITPIAEIDAFFAHLFADPGLRRLAARRPIAPYETEADIPGARPAEAVAEPDEEAPVLEDLELPEAPSLDAANVATPAVRQRRQRKRRRPSLGRN